MEQRRGFGDLAFEMDKIVHLGIEMWSCQSKDQEYTEFKASWRRVDETYPGSDRFETGV